LRLARCASRAEWGVHSPLPAGLVAGTTSSPAQYDYTPETAAASSSRAQARAILAEAGWETDDKGMRTNGERTLSFSIATADTPELVTTAHMLRDAWKRIGVDVDVDVYSSGNLNQQVIRPRQYEALLFGEIIGRGRDFYPFWHSSQQNDPGLNVAQYANIEVDQILEQTRTTHDPDKLRDLYHEFAGIVARDNAAVFLYTPQYIYATPEQLRAVSVGPVTTPPQRFNTVHNWYVDTHWTWRGFQSTPSRTSPQSVFNTHQ